MPFQCDPPSIISAGMPEPQDFDAIMHIEAQAFHPKDADTRTTMQWSASVYPSGFFVARIGSQTVGYLMSRPQGNAAYIHSMAVARNWWRRGIGRHLLQNALHHYARAGYKQAELEVRPDNTVAKLLYTSFGFIPAFERQNFYESDDSPAIVMIKKNLDEMESADSSACTGSLQ